MNALLARARILDMLPIAVFIILFLYLSINSANFLSLPTFELVLKQAVPTIIVSLGLATVIIAGGDDVVSGGIDLSIPAVAIICAAIVANQVTNHQTSLFWGLSLAFVAAGTIGILNAVLVVSLQMTPLLATLAAGHAPCASPCL